MSLKKRKKFFNSRVCGITLSLASFFSFTNNYLFAQNTQERVVEDKFSGSIPHYLVNVRQPINDVDKIIEERKIIDSHQMSYSRNSIASGSVSFDVKLYGKKVNIVLANYVRDTKNIRYFDNSGIHVLSENQLSAVKSDVVKTLDEAVKIAYDKQSLITDKIIGIVEKGLREKNLLNKDEKLENLLDKPVDGFDGVSYADSLNVPVISIKDFVPSKFYFGFTNKALGITWLNTGVVLYNPLARQIDFVNNSPDILAHELTHNNAKLQGIPEVFEFDAEFHASMVMNNNALWFLSHDYLVDSRKISKVLFGFDSELALRQAFGPRMETGIEINKALLEDYSLKIKKISNEINKTYLEEFLPEFYAHLEFWIGVNDELKDKNGSFKVFIYSKYEPSLLGGAKATKEWLEKNEYVIKEASKKTFDELKKQGAPPKPEIFYKDFESFKAFAEFLNVKIESEEDFKNFLSIAEKIKGVFK